MDRGGTKRMTFFIEPALYIVVLTIMSNYTNCAPNSSCIWGSLKKVLAVRPP